MTGLIEADLAGHRYVWSEAAAENTVGTLLLLHGTGGDEHDLVQLGRAISPAAALLSPRGRVREGGMNRFFRRVSEGVFDEDDIRRRASELAYFVGAAAQRHGFDPTHVVAVGFSNGANIAAALMLLQPTVLSGAVLLSPMVPLVPDPLPNLAGRRALIGYGLTDPVASAAQAERLAAILKQSGAEVTMSHHDAGHTIARTELEDASSWLSE